MQRSQTPSDGASRYRDGASTAAPATVQAPAASPIVEDPPRPRSHYYPSITQRAEPHSRLGVWWDSASKALKAPLSSSQPALYHSKYFIVRTTHPGFPLLAIYDSRHARCSNTKLLGYQFGRTSNSDAIRSEPFSRCLLPVLLSSPGPVSAGQITMTRGFAGSEPNAESKA